MDAEALKIILELKEQNVLMERAINEARYILFGRKQTSLPFYPTILLKDLMTQVDNVLRDLETAKKSDVIEEDPI